LQPSQREEAKEVVSQQRVESLKDFRPKFEFFVGIDSDGCVFDTMEVKQKKCFHPNIIKHWGLEAIAPYVKETAQFVNLYSKWRGTNRFPALAMVFDLLRERPEVQASGVAIPELKSLKQWMKEETKLGNPTLEARVAESGDAELAHVLQWSLEINRAVSKVVKGVEPFGFVRESLEEAGTKADLMVVSQTPLEALEREWKEHRLDGHVAVIAGQEHGTKAEHLQYAADGKYPKGHVLMIGDALGDRKAAEANEALFYPVLPGEENASWERFYREGLGRFLDGSFAGVYQEELVKEFESRLPSMPLWK
jgi:phosphoglycolate phosphatase-like HAD superfamily hydrolase